MNARYRSWALMALVILSASGCMLDRDVNDQVEFAPNSKDYSPGFTGFSTGYGGYGGYLNGYGPAFWNPRYYYYTGYNQGYGPGD
ncbi:MAG TPA: hypothetical protein DCZ80_01745 [Legionellales bacterium]|jgi:hypothetical protein|nr:hypothetical protein [Legionellales bacterium]